MRQHNALKDLQQAVARDPGNAELLYLLGAELAQSGEYEQAISALTSAVAINPQLHTARFQLGLLHLTMAQPDRSLAVLAALDELPEDNALKHFKRGLQALATDDFDACIASLRHGIDLNSTNPALNLDMSMIIDRINDTRSTRAAKPAAPPKPRVDEASRRPDLKLYKDIEDT